jgi:SAM-dependent methyltransferase
VTQPYEGIGNIAGVAGRGDAALAAPEGAAAGPRRGDAAATLDDGGGGDGGALVTLGFAGATFLGAFLLFVVQPLIGKYILPWFGGGAAVWTTCLLFFQTALLAGYLYAHLGVSRLGVRAQAAVHAALLLVAAAVALPNIIPDEGWKLTGETANPTGRILLLLLATVGLPCVALAATSPLLHAWYSRIRPGAAVYRLYALSNVGSLLALLAYPLVFEPLLTRRAQATLWSVGLAVFALLCAGCALLASRYAARPRRAAAASSEDDGEAAAAALAKPYVGHTVKPGVALALWLALPACATALLLATTNTMTQDFAPIPFLWVLPLALYLLTFIIAFDRPAWYHRTVFGGILVVGCAALLWVLSEDGVMPPKIGVVVLAFLLFAACMMLHGELARLRPPTARLTAYYLCIAAGGAIGGLLVAVAAPLLLRSYAEFHIAVVAACVLGFAAPFVAERRAPGAAAGFLVPVGLVVLGSLLWAAGSGYLRGGEPRERVRDFYGVLSVFDIPGSGPASAGRRLYHGSITHGHQFTRPERRAEPTTYYRPLSGVGRLLGPRSPLPQPRRIAVVGLGTGTIAAYAQKGDVLRYYEISPTVERVARQWFTYLGDAEARGADVGVIIGDARLSMERQEPQRYDVIALDAFSGDAVPVHLLTLEAIQLYARHLAPGGVILIHVSNRYLDLRAVVEAAAGHYGWASVVVDSAGDRDEGYSAGWVLIGPDPAPIEAIRQQPGVRRVIGAPRDIAPWTDEHANVLGTLE